MDLNINVQELVNGDILVTETAYGDGFYTDSTVGFDESVSVTMLKDKDYGTVKAYIHEHNSTDVSNTFSVTDDGHYTVEHFVVPTMTWWNRVYEEGTLTDWYPVFVSDGVTLYLYEEGNFHELTPEAVYAMAVTSSHHPNVWTASKHVFVIFNLWQCYLNYCRRMLESECSKDSKCSDCDSELMKNLSLLWILLNAIQYYIDLGEFSNAQEFLESISGGCNTLCRNEMFAKDYNCGCS